MLEFDWIKKWNLYRPNAPAVTELDSERSLSYGELHAMGESLAFWTRENLAWSKGDRIAVVSENNVELVVLFSLCQKAGLILVPLNFRLSPHELGELLSDCRPQVLLYEQKFEGLVREIPNTDCGQMLLTDFVSEGSGEASGQWEPPKLSAEDPVFLLYTSGTTGMPKGVIYTHGMLFWNSVNTALSILLGQDSVTINCMPLFHTGGWNVLLTPLLHRGGHTIMMRKLEPAQLLDGLSRWKCTVYMAVPTILKMLSDEAAFQKTEFPELKYILAGGEPMPEPLIEKWHDKGVPIRQGFGMTEAGPNLFSLHQEDAMRKKGSIGRPNFYVQTRVVDPRGKDVTANKRGQLLLKGPMVTPGYWKNQSATERAFTEEGWFQTGDVVLVDEEQYFFVVDRIKNMFISGGENVYPAEVERILVDYPGIAEVVVISVPHEKWGEVGHAFLVSESGNKPSDHQLKGHCEGHLARFKIPKYFTFLDSLPKNATGKLDRIRLKALAEQ